MKDRECLHCTKFYDCTEGKAEETERCINYVERPDLDKEKPQQQTTINWSKFYERK